MTVSYHLQLVTSLNSCTQCFYRPVRLSISFMVMVKVVVKLTPILSESMDLPGG